MDSSGSLHQEEGFQEERGFFRSGQQWETHCCVIASDWPSWLLALYGLGMEEITTVMPTASTEVLEEVQETVIGCSLVDYQEWFWTKADRVKDYDLVLIQGSDYFVSEVQEWFASRKSLAVFGVIPCHGAGSKQGEFLCDKSWTNRNSIQVNHAQTGGITCGQWKIYGDLKLRGLKSSTVKCVFVIS